VTDAALQAFVTSDLIAEVISQIAGGVIDVGPIATGPGGVARATAHGVLRRAEVHLEPGLPIGVRAGVPVAIELTVDAAGGKHRYSADAKVAIRAAIAHEDGCAVVELEPLSSRDVTVRVKAHGLQAKLLQKVGDVDGELRREIAAYVNGRLSGDDVTELRRIPMPSA
jgi:hypothetical protein